MVSSKDQFANPTHTPLILVIDDDNAMRLLLRTLLEKDGYYVTEAEDGVQGISTFQALQPDLVLLDAMMPLMDGFATCTRLRELPGCEFIPILMLTSLTDNDAVDLAFESGATDYIIKPVHKGVLRQRVRHLLRAKQIEDQLRQRERLYRAIVEDQTELICRYLPNHTLTFVNGTYCRYFGKRAEDLIGHNFMGHIAPEDCELIEQHIASLTWHNPVQTLEHKICLPNGEIRWQQWIDRAIFDEQQHLVEFQAVGRDITERKRMEAELHQKTAELQAVFEVIPDIFFRLDSKGTILHYYAGSATDLYLQPEVFIGKPCQEALPPQAASVLLQAVSEVSQTGRPVTVEYSLLMLQGEQTFEARCWPFLEDQIIALVRNITERKQMESRMLNAQKQADLGTLAAGVAHEINSPLQVITGISQSLLGRLQHKQLEPDYLQRKLEAIQRNSWRCAEIVRSLRTYAHVSNSQAEPHNLNAIIQDTLLLMEHQLKNWSDIMIFTDLAPDLPLLWCDRNQITQILINLLTNARDAMSELGEITIRTGYNAETAQLSLQVSDTGCGIPSAIVDKIFDPFFTTKPLGQGTGLGLSIVAGIMRAYGGEIKIDSVPNLGTVITLLFPKDTLMDASLSQPNVIGRFADSL
ncbi:MAG: response regulator [Anaerolineae bacterium]